jgi:Prolyl oligopeptidase family
MKDQLFRSKTFAVEGSEKCACIIAGYRGKITSYAKVIKLLNDRGYTVIAYEHSPAVLTKGKPELLLQLVTGICQDFADKATSYKEIICVGASIGAGLCLAIQRQLPNVTCGIYAGAGVSPPDTIYEAPLFFLVRLKFIRRGFGKNELRKEWAEVDILPDTNFAHTPMIMVLGKNDLVVRYGKALSTLHAWQAKGQRIQILSKAGLGHVGIIRWYKHHFSELLDYAEQL